MPSACRRAPDAVAPSATGRRLKIGIDATCLASRRGYGRFLRELLPPLLEPDDDHEDDDDDDEHDDDDHNDHEDDDDDD